MSEKYLCPFCNEELRQIGTSGQCSNCLQVFKLACFNSPHYKTLSKQLSAQSKVVEAAGQEAQWYKDVELAAAGCAKTYRCDLCKAVDAIKQLEEVE